MSKVRFSVLALLGIGLGCGLVLGSSGIESNAVAQDLPSRFAGQREASTPPFFDVHGNPQTADQEADQEVAPSGDVGQPTTVNNYGDYVAQAVDPTSYANTGSQPYVDQGLGQVQDYDQTYSPYFGQ